MSTEATSRPQQEPQQKRQGRGRSPPVQKESVHGDPRCGRRPCPSTNAGRRRNPSTGGRGAEGVHPDAQEPQQKPIKASSHSVQVQVLLAAKPIGHLKFSVTVKAEATRGSTETELQKDGET